MKNLKRVFILIPFCLVGCQHEAPQGIGVVGTEDGTSLNNCREFPRCVSSTHDESDKDRYIDAIKIEEPQAVAMSKLVGILNTTSDLKIISLNPDYIYATYSAGFPNVFHDVEFQYHHKTNIILLRSASRGKLPDFGTDRKWLETIRFRFHQNDVQMPR